MNAKIFEFSLLVGTHQPALGPRGGLWHILLMCNPFVSCGVRDKIKEKHLSLSSMDVVKGD
jgi:hypothetical protein